MLRIRRILIGVAACAHLGCYAIDELDKGWEKMNKIPSPPPAETAEPVPYESAEAERTLAHQRAQSKQWWKDSRTLSAKDLNAQKAPEDKIVSCDLDGGSQFMQRADCLARGGTPKN